MKDRNIRFISWVSKRSKTVIPTQWDVLNLIDVVVVVQYFQKLEGHCGGPIFSQEPWTVDISSTYKVEKITDVFKVLINIWFSSF